MKKLAIGLALMASFPTYADCNQENIKTISKYYPEVNCENINTEQMQLAIAKDIKIYADEKENTRPELYRITKFLWWEFKEVAGISYTPAGFLFAKEFSRSTITIHSSFLEELAKVVVDESVFPRVRHATNKLLEESLKKSTRKENQVAHILFDAFRDNRETLDDFNFPPYNWFVQSETRVNDKDLLEEMTRYYLENGLCHLHITGQNFSILSPDEKMIDDLITTVSNCSSSYSETPSLNASYKKMYLSIKKSPDFNPTASQQEKLNQMEANLKR